MLKFQGQNARLRFPAFSFQNFSRGAGPQNPLEMMGLAHHMAPRDQQPSTFQENPVSL